MLPEIDKDFLVDLGGWDLLKDARALCRTQVVQEVNWEEPNLRGKLRSGGGIFHPRIEINPGRVPTSECNCRKGQAGYVCVHVMTLACHVMEEGQREAEPPKPSEAEHETSSF